MVADPSMATHGYSHAVHINRTHRFTTEAPSNRAIWFYNGWQLARHLVLQQTI